MCIRRVSERLKNYEKVLKEANEKTERWGRVGDRNRDGKTVGGKRRGKKVSITVYVCL